MLNVAIIGCGEMGRMHAACVNQLGQWQLYAFCDLDLSRARFLQEQYGSAVATTDPAAVFADPQVNLVYITTHTASHKQLCLAAIQSQKHLLIEKPVALTAAETLEISTAVDKAGLIAMVGMKFRFYEMVQKAHALVPTPYMISVQVMDDPWPADFWANDPVIGGGNVISQGIHGSDLLRFLAAADPVSVFAVAANYHQPTGVVDNLSATFRFSNGLAGALVVGDCGRPPVLGKFMVQLFGHEGTAILFDRLTKLEFHEHKSGEILRFAGEEDGFLEENRTLLKILNHEQAPVSSVWDGYVAQAMIDRALCSAVSGTTLSVL
jgi:predicted dehydrogenase